MVVGNPVMRHLFVEGPGLCDHCHLSSVFCSLVKDAGCIHCSRVETSSVHSMSHRSYHAYPTSAKFTPGSISRSPSDTIKASDLWSNKKKILHNR